MLGHFRATPFARLISSMFEDGFSKEIDHMSLLGFFNSTIPQKNLSCSSFQFKGSWVKLEGFRVCLGKGVLQKSTVALPAVGSPRNFIPPEKEDDQVHEG